MMNLEMMHTRRTFYAKYGKRCFDLALTLPGVIVISPVLIIITLLVKRHMGSPVLFRQQRPGLNGKPFTMYKLRTMTNERHENGTLLPNEQRLTVLGKFLRNSSLDELPTLLNVIKGDMSLVGPRPLRVRYLPYFSIEQKKRHNVMPGITGFAQVSGRVGINWDEKLSLDVEYVNHLSFFFDVKILLLTLAKVLQRKGVATQTGDNFEQPFDDYVKAKGNRDA